MWKEKKGSLYSDGKMCLSCDFPWEPGLGEWLETEGCFDYQEDSPLAILRKPSAPLRISCSLIECSKFCPGRFTGDCASAHRVLQGDLQNQHLFSSLCIIGKFFIKLDTLFNENWLCVSNVYSGPIFPKVVVKALRSPVVKKPMSLYLIQRFSYISDHKTLLA